MLVIRITISLADGNIGYCDNHRGDRVLEGNPAVDMNQDLTRVYSLQSPTIGHACQTHTAAAGSG